MHKYHKYKRKYLDAKGGSYNNNNDEDERRWGFDDDFLDEDSENDRDNEWGFDDDFLLESPNIKAKMYSQSMITETSDYIIIKTGEIMDKPNAVFDLDYTLIKTKSGKKFPKDGDDWVFLYPNLREKLVELGESYNIIIFTNQKGLNKNDKKVEFVRKIEQINKELGLPLQVYISLADGFYRKPLTGLWDLFMSGKELSRKDFYCGDAAGRKGDFAATDLMFANNIGIPFFLPENIFLGSDIKLDYQWPEYLIRYIGEAPNIEIPMSGKTMVLMCGYPGCGKSSIARQFGYIIASNDEEGTAARCKKKVTNALKSGNNIVVDNTNATLGAREVYYQLAKKYGYRVGIVYLDNDIQFCYYMNQLRCQLSHGVEKLIPKIAYYTMRKRFLEPSRDECDFLIKTSNMVSGYKYMFPGL